MPPGAGTEVNHSFHSSPSAATRSSAGTWSSVSGSSVTCASCSITGDRGLPSGIEVGDQFIFEIRNHVLQPQLALLQSRELQLVAMRIGRHALDRRIEVAVLFAQFGQPARQRGGIGGNHCPSLAPPCTNGDPAIRVKSPVCQSPVAPLWRGIGPRTGSKPAVHPPIPRGERLEL